MNPLNGHGYITGVVLMGVGVLGCIGSFTGNLAPMLAALFSPEYLAPPTDASSSNPAASLQKAIGNSTNPLTYVLNPLGPSNAIVKGVLSGVGLPVPSWVP